jgi:hypothetical protein
MEPEVNTGTEDPDVLGGTLEGEGEGQGTGTGEGAEGEGQQSGGDGTPQPDSDDAPVVELEYEDGTKKPVTLADIRRSVDAEDRVTTLSAKHKKVLDEFSALKGRLAEMERAGGGRPQGQPGGQQTQLQDGDLTITREDLQDTDALAGKLSRLVGAVNALSTQLRTANDPVERAKNIQAETFRMDVQRAVKADPLLKKMDSEGSMAIANSAIAWAIQQNDIAGQEVYDTPAKAIDGYKKAMGLIPAAQSAAGVDRKLKKISRILKTPSGPQVSGGAGEGGDLMSRWTRMSPRERVVFESKLSPEDSRRLAHQMAKADSG